MQYYRQELPCEAKSPALNDVAGALSRGTLPFLKLPEQESDLPVIAREAERIRSRFAHLVVMGTGGSSLGGLTLVSLKQPRFLAAGTQVHFLDNSDPDTFRQLCEQLPLADCCFLAVSKSGNTAETLAQFQLILQQLARDSLPVADQCLALSMPGDNPLRRLAMQHGIRVIDHDPQLGGRFSVLSNVALIPAAVAGLDIYALRQGAASVMQDLRENGASSAPARGAVMQRELNKSISVLMPYCDRLENLGRWYQQLWAESLGKNGQGSTPVRALGAVDQHSQLQLYLDGPRDKVVTLVELERQQSGERILAEAAQCIGLDYLAGQSLGDIIAAQQQGTAQSLMRHGVPVRRLVLPELSEASLGALLQHFMLETALLAGLLGINAYDQPAVEESKQLARESLASAGKVAV